VLDDRGRVDPHKIDLVGRLGRFYYARASGDAIYSIEQRVDRFGLGFDQLPDTIRHSAVLTGNELAQLASLSAPPTTEELAAIANDIRLVDVLKHEQPLRTLHLLVKQELSADNLPTAAQLAWWGVANLKP
jgi:hypothetical protein